MAYWSLYGLINMGIVAKLPIEVYVDNIKTEVYGSI
jgi:hypothetical protein